MNREEAQAKRLEYVKGVLDGVQGKIDDALEGGVGDRGGSLTARTRLIDGAEEIRKATGEIEQIIEELKRPEKELADFKKILGSLRVLIAKIRVCNGGMEALRVLGEACSGLEKEEPLSVTDGVREVRRALKEIYEHAESTEKWAESMSAEADQIENALETLTGMKHEEEGDEYEWKGREDDCD